MSERLQWVKVVNADGCLKVILEDVPYANHTDHATYANRHIDNAITILEFFHKSVPSGTVDLFDKLMIRYSEAGLDLQVATEYLNSKRVK